MTQHCHNPQQTGDSYHPSCCAEQSAAANTTKESAGIKDSARTPHRPYENIKPGSKHATGFAALPDVQPLLSEVQKACDWQQASGQNQTPQLKGPH